MRVADFALTWHEDEYVAARIVMRDFIKHGGDVLGTALLHVRCTLIATRSHFIRGAPTHLYRVRTALDGHHRCVAEMLGEARGIDRCGGDDDLQLGPLYRQALEITEQKIDV